MAPYGHARAIPRLPSRRDVRPGIVQSGGRVLRVRDLLLEQPQEHRPRRDFGHGRVARVPGSERKRGGRCGRGHRGSPRPDGGRPGHPSVPHDARVGGLLDASLRQSHLCGLRVRGWLHEPRNPGIATGRTPNDRPDRVEPDPRPGARDRPAERLRAREPARHYPRGAGRGRGDRTDRPLGLEWRLFVRPGPGDVRPLGRRERLDVAGPPIPEPPVRSNLSVGRSERAVPRSRDRRTEPGARQRHPLRVRGVRGPDIPRTGRADDGGDDERVRSVSDSGHLRRVGQ